MVVTILGLISSILNQCVRWFVLILNAVGGTNTYYTAVFTAMTCGFLLARFGSGLRAGSDLAAKSIRKRREKE